MWRKAQRETVQTPLLRQATDAIFVSSAAGEVHELAMQLASKGRSDAEAVDTLTRVAKNRKKRLREAAELCLVGGQAMEFAQANLALRLLEAALLDSAVADVSSREENRIATISAFDKLSDEQQWKVIAEKLPVLNELRSESLHRIEEAQADDPSLISWIDWIVALLDQVVGPHNGSADPLTSSSYARSVVGDMFFADLPARGTPPTT